MLELQNFSQPYGSPLYFFLLIGTMLPVIVALYFGRRLRLYETGWTLFFLWLTFGGAHVKQGLALIAYLTFETLLVWGYQRYRQTHNQTAVFIMVIVLGILPLILVKVAPLIHTVNLSLVGFLGISYLTFKAVQVLMELRDGTIKTVTPLSFIRFMSFFPTVSSGPIDRFRRFESDIQVAPSRNDYVEMLGQAVKYLFLGCLYKYMIGYVFGTLMLPHVAHEALLYRGAFFGTGFSLPLLGYMYVYSMYLFFDFAGYSLFAMGISYLLGVRTPRNFNQPFRAHNIKDFWNRWHMSLSFWFRDFVFMRFTVFVMKHRLIHNRIRISQTAYLFNFLVMGFWHGVTWYYIVYGLFHAGAIIVNDIWLRFKKRRLPGLPHNRLTEAVAIFITFNTVCLSFLIFSGFLDKLWQ